MKILGLDSENPQYEQLGGIAKPENVLILSGGMGVTGRELCLRYRFVEMNPWVHEEYAKSIATIVDSIHGGILIFFPSYTHLRETTNFLRTANPKSPIFFESRDTVESRDALKAYEKEVQTNGKAILAGVFRGRFAEGTDLPHELSRAVIICGIPFARWSDPYIKAKRAYYEQQEIGLFSEWYRTDAYRLVAQALGRGWRHPEDYAVGILLDSRYQQQEFVRYLPYWLRTRSKTIDSFDTAVRETQTFLNERKGTVDVEFPEIPILRPRIRLRDQVQVCQICKSEILTAENIELCPNCSSPFHLVHLLEWLKVHGICPVCRAELVVE